MNPEHVPIPQEWDVLQDETNPLLHRGPWNFDDFVTIFAIGSDNRVTGAHGFGEILFAFVILGK